MTEDEAIHLLKKGNRLYHLPKQFHNNEFVMKCIIVNDLHINTHDLVSCDIKIDYNIALVSQMRWCKIHRVRHSPNTMNIMYEAWLSDEEIAKLHTTLTLIYGN